MEYINDLSTYSYRFLHRRSVVLGHMNFRGQGQRSSQGQMTKMTYFSRKWRVISIKTNLICNYWYNIFNTCIQNLLNKATWTSEVKVNCQVKVNWQKWHISVQNEVLYPLKQILIFGYLSNMVNTSYMHRESAKQGYVNFRGQCQRSSQGQMTKITYFSRKWSDVSITTDVDIQFPV